MSSIVLDQANPLPEDSDDRLKFILTYWNGKRGPRRFPARKDIDPLDFYKQLPLIYLVDGTRMEDLYVRLAGTAYRELYGFEITGKRVVELIPRARASEVLDDYELCLTHGKPVFRANAMTWRPREARISYERLLLPLGIDDSQVTQILAMATFYSIDGHVLFAGESVG